MREQSIMYSASCTSAFLFVDGIDGDLDGSSRSGRGFVWNSREFSRGHPRKSCRKKNMIGDGAFGKGRGENRFWAVATPL